MTISVIYYILRWTSLAISTGVIVGAGVAAFLRLLSWSISAWSEMEYYYFFLPVFLLLNRVLVNLLAFHSAGGSDMVLEAIHRQNGKLSLAGIPAKMGATVITIAAGGSAGKEGPAAQLGATLASAWARLLNIENNDCRKIVICGLCAGFACVFGTPVAGAVFGVEVLFIGKLLYDTLYPAFLAAVTAYLTCQLLGVAYFYQPVYVAAGGWLVVQAILLGLVCGSVAVLFIKSIQWWQELFVCWRLPQYINTIIGGILLSLVGYFISPLYLGLGLELFEAGINGQNLAATAFFWKTVTTGITLGCGGTGGIITPVIVVGAATGNLFGQILGSLDVSVYSAIGMAALLAGAVNTPVAAVIMSAELFGGEVLPYTAVSCLISYLVAGHRSVYPSQIIFSGKVPFLCDDEGKTVRCARREAKKAFLAINAKINAGRCCNKENTDSRDR
ncbi:chloride channel protein [Sporomusa aerivorans]|uniref:chloride channel protein n=1 Tax=Sporomusa aerivorans TaxID=204936 RepID=UPI00352A1958